MANFKTCCSRDRHVMFRFRLYEKSGRQVQREARQQNPKEEEILLLSGYKIIFICHPPKCLWGSPCLNVIMMTGKFLPGKDTVYVYNNHVCSHGLDDPFCKSKSNFHWQLNCVKVRSWFIQTCMREQHLYCLCCVSVSRAKLRLQKSPKRRPTVTKTHWSSTRHCATKLSQEKSLAFFFFSCKASPTPQYRALSIECGWQALSCISLFSSWIFEADPYALCIWKMLFFLDYPEGWNTENVFYTSQNQKVSANQDFTCLDVG